MSNADPQGTQEPMTISGCLGAVLLIGLMFGVPGYVMVAEASPWPWLTQLQLRVLPGNRYFPAFNLAVFCIGWWSLLVAPIAHFSVVHKKLFPGQK